MRGYHYLMRIGHLLNVPAAFSSKLIKIVKEKGLQGFIRFVRQTLSGRWRNSFFPARRTSLRPAGRLIQPAPSVKPFPLAPHTPPLGPIESTDASALT